MKQFLHSISIILIPVVTISSCVNNNNFEERRGEEEARKKSEKKGSKVSDAKKQKSPKKQKPLVSAIHFHDKKQIKREEQRQSKYNSLNNKAERLALVMGILIKKNYKFEFLESHKKNIKTKTKIFFDIVQVWNENDQSVFNIKDKETEKKSENHLSESMLLKNKRDYSFNWKNWVLSSTNWGRLEHQQRGVA